MEEIVWSKGEKPQKTLKRETSKREDLNTKMNERYQICQVPQNPFLAHSNFVEDLTKFSIKST